ncbi:MAG: hypothetical protein JSS89_13185 [Bacteroidetes bacterium]|nr:hypothetical protein [Bacteroidota bacterium]
MSTFSPPKPKPRGNTLPAAERVRTEQVELPSEPQRVDVNPIERIFLEAKPEDFQQQQPEFQPFLLSNAQIERYFDANPDIKGMFCDSKTRWSYGEKITKYEPINWKLVGKYIFWIDSSKQVHMDPRKWDDALPPAMPGGVR